MSDVRKNTRTLVHRLEPVFKVAIPTSSGLTPERFGRLLITTLEANPDLFDCSPASLARAMIQAAEVGLEPGGALGLCYLLPYWNSKRGCSEAEFSIGVWGYVALAKRSEQVRDVWSDVIYSGDAYRIISGTREGRGIEHEPRPWLPDRGEAIGAYASASLANGETSWRFVSEADCQLAKARSKPGAKDRGPWGEWADEMRCKVALKRARKYWPQVREVARAIEIEEDPGSLSPELSEAAGRAMPELAEERSGFNANGALDAVMAREKSAPVQEMPERTEDAPDDEPPPEVRLPGQEEG